ncbi:quinate dehydrogenase [Lineolata rhizophorae]|uniref:Quinate dehydrogenase n=1 Tax=Lineolata rhizophorae TaxID=578093 RepID=A0A6A6P7N6_9PEZI|nr:quinate dehydrogenase [Lineolata rhizophorae]
MGESYHGADRLDRIGYLFGHPISHSMSPLLHRTVYEALHLNWAQIPLESTDMDLFLRLIDGHGEKFYGASVTMPHKVAIMKHCDELTDEARDVGACNTLFIRDDPELKRRILVGTNTDVIGIRDAFYENVAYPEKVFHDRPALVVGGGGAARSAIYALRTWLHSSHIYIVNRDEREVATVLTECARAGYGAALSHVSSVKEAEALPAPGAIISCIPDIAPRTEPERITRRIVQVILSKPQKGAILEMCYHPNPFTTTARLAKTAGWQVILGTEALIWQGLEQDRFWTGRDVHELPVKAVHAAIEKELARHQEKELDSVARL